MYRLEIDKRGARLIPVNNETIRKLVVVDKKFLDDLKNHHYYEIVRVLKDTSPQDNKGICFVEAKHMDNCLECRKNDNLMQFNLIESDIIDTLNTKAIDLGFLGINIPLEAVEGFIWLDFKCQNNIVIPTYLHWWQQFYGDTVKVFDPINIHNFSIEIFAKSITTEEIEKHRERCK